MASSVGLFVRSRDMRGACVARVAEAGGGIEFRAP